jgi:hypothetical protein
MALIDQYNLRTNDVLLKRITAACDIAATTILNENVATPNHDLRMKFAAAQIASDKPSQYMFRRALQNSTVQAGPDTITDPQIQTFVNANLESIAQVL